MSTQKLKHAFVAANGDVQISPETNKSTTDEETVHPATYIRSVAKQLGCDVTDRKLAEHLDAIDPLKSFRDMFFYPKNKDLLYTDLSLIDGEEDCVYFVGNSLGLQPKGVNHYIQKELDKWAKTGVQGHTNGDLPWAYCDEKVDYRCAKLIGAKESEVALMNGLTVNLHLLLISFYRPTQQRHKIFLESKAFPSDHYAFESQIKLHGYDPETSMVCLEPREGEFCLRTEDILKKIEDEGDSISVICFSGVQYYTGQLFDMEAITKAGHAKGCYVGFDLAHAIGNAEIFLDDWDVDFACWCTYKYLCSSAGGLAGAYLNDRFSLNDFPKLVGWWGHKMSTRFVMDNKLDLSPGIAGYRISNPPPLLCCPLLASFDIYEKTSMSDLRRKSKILTGYLELLLSHHFPKPEDGEVTDKPFTVIVTPSDPEQRGCQLSVMFSLPIKKVFKELEKRGVMCDEREPNVLRLAPKPIYNKFDDVYRFIELLEASLIAAKE
ncbi:kynureninase-like isoform X2 [Lineus longissimus]